MRLCRVLTLCFIVSFLPGLAHGQELICRGGGTMRIMVAHAVNGEGVAGKTVMYVYFKPSPAPSQNPQSGECAFPAAVAHSKPLWIDSPRGQFAFQVTADGRVVNDGKPRVNVEGAGLSEENTMWDAIVSGVMQGKVFRVQVEEKANIYVIKSASAD